MELKKLIVWGRKTQCPLISPHTKVLFNKHNIFWKIEKFYFLKKTEFSAGDLEVELQFQSAHRSRHSSAQPNKLEEIGCWKIDEKSLSLNLIDFSSWLNRTKQKCTMVYKVLERASFYYSSIINFSLISIEIRTNSIFIFLPKIFREKLLLFDRFRGQIFSDNVLK